MAFHKNHLLLVKLIVWYQTFLELPTRTKDLYTCSYISSLAGTDLELICGWCTDFGEIYLGTQI